MRDASRNIKHKKSQIPRAQQHVVINRVSLSTLQKALFLKWRARISLERENRHTHSQFGVPDGEAHL